MPLDPEYEALLRSADPAQAMKRIEATIRAPLTNAAQMNASAGRSLGSGYGGTVGAQMGPLSGGIMAASDPQSGQPVMVGGRANIGPVGYAYMQPTAKGAPAAHTVSIGGKPFDADTYFGVQAQRTPGGLDYGVNVSRGNQQGNAFLAAGYNPQQRGVNVMGGLQRSFNHGGPVHMDEGGLAPLTIRRQRPPEDAPVGPREEFGPAIPIPPRRPVEPAAVSEPEAYNRRFAETVMGAPAAIGEYFAEKAQQPDPSQRIAEDIAFGAQGLASIPGKLFDYLGRKAEQPDPSQQIVNDVMEIGGKMKEEFVKNPGGFMMDMANVPGMVTAVQDAARLKREYNEAVAAGDEEKASSLKAMFGGTMLAGLPLVGPMAKIAEKGVVRAISEGIEATDKAVVDGTVSSAKHTAAVETPQVPSSVFQPEPVMTAFDNVPAPEALRDSVIGEITRSIEDSEGAVAKLPTTMGLGPMYVVESGVQPEGKGFILAGTTNKNAPTQIEGISPLLEKYPDMALNPDQWATGMAEATGNSAVVAPPYRFMKEILPGGDYEVILKNMTPGQIAERRQGIAAGKEFFDAFVNGQMKVEDTGKLFMWGMLSRGVNPFTHEGLFMDAFSGIEPWIKMAAEGRFTKEIAEGPYKEWAASTAQKGSGQPGAGAMHNLNAFGEDFLLKMGTPGADGITPLQKIHDLMTDPSLSGRDIRRAFASTGEGVGIDNKVVSFIMLATGRDDVMVIDRIQLKNLWDDGRFEDFNIWDGISAPVVKTADGKTTRFPPTEEGRAQAKAFKEANPGSESGNAAVTGSSLAEATYGAKGVLAYEAIEDALMKSVQDLYDRIGMGGEKITPGIFHWDTWVARSNQEASHGTLPAVLKQAQGAESPLEGIYSKQGDYQTYAYGAKYFRGPDGPYFTMPLSNGDELRLSVSEMQRLQGELSDFTKGAVPVPTPMVTNPVTGEVREFANTPAGRKEANAYAAELTAAAREEARAANPSLSRSEITAIKVPVDERGFSVSSVEGRPWYEDQSINRERVDKLIRNAAQRTEQSAGSTAQAAVPNVAGRTVDAARSAAGFDTGLPRTYGAVAGGQLRQVVNDNPPAFKAPVVNAFEPNPSAASVYNQTNHSTPLVYELGAGSEAAKDFHSAISKAKKENPYGAAVTLYRPKEYAGMRLFLTPDGTAGFALKGDDIVSVFNAPKGPHRKVANSLLDIAISQGGRKLDAFDTALPLIYSASGFKTTSRMSFDPQYAPPGWDYKTFSQFNEGKPDVIHMVYDPRHKAPYDPSDGRFFKDYDDAVDYQNKLVKTTNNYLDATRKGYDKKMKKATEATSFIPGFAEGGKVERPIAKLIHRIGQRDLTQLELSRVIKRVVGEGTPAAWAHALAGHIIAGRLSELEGHSKKYPRILHVLKEIDEELS